MIPMPPIWWLMSYVIRWLCVAISIQSVGLIASARIWDGACAGLLLMSVPGLVIMGLWVRRGIRAVRRLYRWVRA
jgi:hypothetical protein